MTDMFGLIDKLKAFFRDDPSSYGRAKRLAADSDSQVRKELAEREDIKPEILYFLADDPDPRVRREIAKNNTTPRQADSILVKDKDDSVRTVLAEKIARLAPDLNRDEREDIRTMTIDILERLARDKLPSIRQILAETLKDVADAPPKIILRLASDDVLMVASPVLENSPVLTDDDLLKIIAARPQPGALGAICRRKALSAGVSDGIVGTKDKQAIAELLTNPSAQIREETLDQLVEGARQVDIWQEPLVHRPALPESAVIRLSEFVADIYLDVLEQRKDLDASTIAKVKLEVHRRMEGGGAIAQQTQSNDIESGGAEIIGAQTDISLEAAKRQMKSGNLEGKDIERALNGGDKKFVISALAVRSDLPVPTVEKIIGSRNPGVVAAMVWKGGLSVRISTVIQERLAHIPKADLLQSADGRNYPLTEEELEKQLAEFTASDAI